MIEPTFEIREVGDEDYGAVLNLDRLCHVEGKRHRGSELLFDQWGPFERRWESRGTGRSLFVAVSNSEIVGWSSVVQESRPRPLLETIFVHPEARQLGVGAALLREALTRFGGDHLDALSLPGDRLTKNLFERGGLKARLIVAASL